MTAGPDTALEALKRRFVIRCAADLAQLEAYAGGAGVSREDLRFLLHRLAGSARIFGHGPVGDLAGELETVLLEEPADAAVPVDALIAELRALQSSGGQAV